MTTFRIADFYFPKTLLRRRPGVRPDPKTILNMMFCRHICTGMSVAWWRIWSFWCFIPYLYAKCIFWFVCRKLCTNEYNLIICKIQQVRAFALSRLSRSQGRSAAEAAAAELCALKMIMLHQLRSGAEQAALRSEIRKVHKIDIVLARESDFEAVSEAIWYSSANHFSPCLFVP